jgi:hypothetical protein
MKWWAYQSPIVVWAPVPSLCNQDSIDLTLIETCFGEIIECTIDRFYPFALCSLGWQFIDALPPSLSHATGRFDTDKRLDVERGVIGVFRWRKQESGKDTGTGSRFEDGEGSSAA